MKRLERPDWNREQLRDLALTWGTPLYVYDLATVLARVEALRARDTFDRIRYAQKANPNLALLEQLRGAGVCLDAVSAGEIARALAAGFEAEEIAYTSDVFDRRALELVAEHPVAVNLGTVDMADQLAEVRPGAEVTLRVNPGFGGGHDRKVTTGGELSKHGIWHAALDEAYRRCAELGLTVAGLHVHIGSGLDGELLRATCDAMAALVRAAPESVRSISTGGGLPVPYRPTDEHLDLDTWAGAWQDLRRGLETALRRPLELEVEPGRFLVAESGVLVTEVRGVKRQGANEFVLVDAGFHTLARPMLYGAYHEITRLDGVDAERAPRIVAGPLCESSDVFTVDETGAPEPRPLPSVAPGDLLCVHDVGAYGASMSSGYNSQPIPAEVLIVDGAPKLARRSQTLEEQLTLEKTR